MLTQDRFLRWPEVERRVGCSKSKVRKLEAAGEFPRRVTLGPRAVGWLESEINQWIAKRAAERDDVEAVAATKLKRTPRKAPTEGVLLPEFRGEHPVP